MVKCVKTVGSTMPNHGWKVVNQAKNLHFPLKNSNLIVKGHWIRNSSQKCGWWMGFVSTAKSLTIREKIQQVTNKKAIIRHISLHPYDFHHVLFFFWYGWHSAKFNVCIQYQGQGNCPCNLAKNREGNETDTWGLGPLSNWEPVIREMLQTIGSWY